MTQAPTTIFLMADTLNTRAIVAAATATEIRVVFQWLMFESPEVWVPLKPRPVGADFPLDKFPRASFPSLRCYFGAENR
jgi:hypothetical protein